MGQGAGEGPKNPVRIDVADEAEVARWAVRLGCSEADLRTAVGEVGPLAERVRHWLARQQPPANDPRV